MRCGETDAATGLDEKGAGETGEREKRERQKRPGIALG